MMSQTDDVSSSLPHTTNWFLAAPSLLSIWSCGWLASVKWYNNLHSILGLRPISCVHAMLFRKERENVNVVLRERERRVMTKYGPGVKSSYPQPNLSSGQ